MELDELHIPNNPKGTGHIQWATCLASPARLGKVSYFFPKFPHSSSLSPAPVSVMPAALAQAKLIAAALREEEEGRSSTLEITVL